LPPIGIEYRLNNFNIIFLLLVNIIAIFAQMTHLKESSQSLFFIIIAGFNGMIMANDIFNIYVFLEISSLATYAFLALGDNKKSLIAAFDYLIIGTISASFYLLGTGFLYAYSGTLNITDMQNVIAPHTANPMVICGAIFIIIGLAIKSAIFPAHLWMVKCYTNTNSFASTFLSGVATKVAIYLLMRLYFTILHQIIDITLPIEIITIIAIIICSAWLLLCRNFKHLLAVSSILNIAYIIMAFSINNEIGIAVTIISIITHALAKSPLFLIAGICDQELPATSNKIINATTIINTSSLVGIPLTAGFISKILLIYALITNQNYISLLAVLVASIITIYAFFQLYEKQLEKQTIDCDITLFQYAGLSIFAATNILLGVYAAPLIDYVKSTAQIVIKGAM
jgi:multicomponent Na+:H+ antiporter subunit D